LRVDARGRETGIAEVHFGQRVWPSFVLFLHKKKFFGHEILVLTSEQHVANEAVSPPPRGLRALALAMGVLPPSEAAAMVQAQRMVSAEEHCALSYDVAGSTTVQHQLTQLPDWWPYNNPRICCRCPPYRSFADQSLMAAIVGPKCVLTLTYAQGSSKKRTLSCTFDCAN